MTRKKFLHRGYFRTIISLGCLVFATGMISAQSTDFQNLSKIGHSSWHAGLIASGLQRIAFAPPSSPQPAGSGGNGGGFGGDKRGFLHRDWVFEASGGFNAPISSAVSYGSNFTVGSGRRFNKYISGLIEYQYINDKLPLSLMTAANATGAGAHIWSFTMDPVFDLFPQSSDDLYITGGGGFYRALTSFSNHSNSMFHHFSSNQGDINIGGGYQHRTGGMFGDSHTTIFAEVRFVDVLTPQAVYGTTIVQADTKVVPVTFGVRF